MNPYSVPVVIPSYNPDEKLCPTVSGLISAGFTNIIVIDDGSSPETKKNFPESGEFVTVLRHEVNRGKGAGLKTAFRYILEKCPDAPGCVTADGDGQHRIEDIESCVRRMLEEGDKIVLGARDFSLENVPERSRKGNRITSRVFRLLFGMVISDTQTGLRAFPKKYLPSMLNVSGDRYEYETNMLISMKRENIPFCEEKIETVYIDGNSTSHFRPIRDSIRIYGMILKFLLASVLSFVLDAGLFTVFNLLLFSGRVKWAYAASTVCARIISSAVNYTLNRRVVFASGKRDSVIRYYILAAGILAASTLLGQTVTNLLSVAPPLQTAVAVIINLILFFASFRIQNQWVFKND